MRIVIHCSAVQCSHYVHFISFFGWVLGPSSSDLGQWKMARSGDGGLESVTMLTQRCVTFNLQLCLLHWLWNKGVRCSFGIWLDRYCLVMLLNLVFIKLSHSWSSPTVEPNASYFCCSLFDFNNLFGIARFRKIKQFKIR